MKNAIEEYCTGCGLCHAVCGVEMSRDENGFPCFNIESELAKRFCKNVCPAMNNSTIFKTPWGEGDGWCGWSTNSDIRFNASSGGIITSLCIYLLESGKVDAVLQVGAVPGKPWRTKLYCNESKEDILKCCGSRYVASSPLYNIVAYLREEKKYAFVGRPCDIVALKNYEKIKPEIREKVPYTLSFFCAGAPSEKAQEKLLNALDSDFDHCRKLVYRGNGWPGFATVYNDDGIEKRMTYNDSWGKILGRDIRKVCRVCIDGIGEQADIACGDAWYLQEDGTPDFSEHDGRNVVFGRTMAGKKLLKSAMGAGYIFLEPFNLDSLKSIQRFQLERRSTMAAKIFALKLMGKATPRYSWKKVLQFIDFVSLSDQYKWFRGSISRIKQGKL